MDNNSKEEYEKIVKGLISSKNDLLDEVHVLSCGLSFIAEATNQLMDNDNSNIMEDVSYGLYSQLNGLKDKLNNLLREFESNIETTVDNLYFFLDKKDKK